MRPFAPPAFAIQRPDFHATLIETRLSHSGEYVRHLPFGGTPQWVVMNYQYIPLAASTANDFIVSGANPHLWGYIDHFADKPELYKDGDSVRPARGSQFEIRGLTYNVKRVDINHVGYVHIELVLNDKCAVARPEFIDEQGDLLCTTAPVCPDA